MIVMEFEIIEYEVDALQVMDSECVEVGEKDEDDRDVLVEGAGAGEVIEWIEGLADDALFGSDVAGETVLVAVE